MRRTWNLLGGLLSLAVVGIVLVLLVLLFWAQGGQSQVAQQPYPVGTQTRPPVTTQDPRTFGGQNVELIGQIGGLSYAVAVHGSYAYLGVGPRLLILDVSDPARPRVVGRTAVFSDLVYAVHVAGRYAYVGTWKRLEVIDVSNPTAPRAVGASETLGLPKAIHVVGTYAYVADWDLGLLVIDVSNPAAPVKAGAYETPGQANDVHVVGSYAFVSAWGAGLRVIDVSDPTMPREVAAYMRGGGANVYVADSYAYLGGTTFDIINVSDPIRPIEMGSIDLPCCIHKIYVAGGYAYIANQEAGLLVIDVSNPIAPTRLGAYATSIDARDVFVVNDQAYIADHEASLHIINTSDPTAPVRVSAYTTLPIAGNLYVASGYAYVVTGDALSVVDVSDPAAPVQVGVHRTLKPALNIHIAGRYAYITGYVCSEKRGCGDGALEIVDISDPGAPAHVGIYNAPGMAEDVYTRGDYAYVAAGQAGLRVVSVTNPANPHEVGAYVTPGHAVGVTVAGRYAYVIDQDVSDGRPPAGGGLRIIDIANPTAPSLVGNYYTGRWPTDVHVAGGYAYIANLVHGLQVADVSHPAAPVGAGGYVTPREARALYVAGSYAHIVDWDLHVLHISSLSSVVKVGTYTPPRVARDVFVTSGYIYLTNDDGGLLILRFPAAVTAPISTNGGNLDSPFDQTTYGFAAGTFTDTVTVTHIPHLSGDAPPAGSLVDIHHLFDVQAVYSSTGQPVVPTRSYTITVHYSEVEKGPAVEGTLALYYHDGNHWVREPSSTVDTAAKRVIARPMHLSSWGVLGETQRVFLPLVR